VGAADGSIALIDVRQTENPLYESVESNRGIHKLLFNPNPERSEFTINIDLHNSITVYKKQFLLRLRKI